MVVVHTALSELSDTRAALEDAHARLTEGLGGAPDLALVFTSNHHAAAWSRLPAVFAELLPDTEVAGCSAAGIIGEGHEAEQRCALALWGARGPDLSISSAHLDPADMPASAEDWRAALPQPAPALAIVLGDPLSSDPARFLPGLQSHWPDTAVVGGLASGGSVPGSHALFAGDRCHRVGTVVIGVGGPLSVRTVVAQGCRPIGEPMLVTRCEGRRIQELGGRPPVEVLRELYASLPARDQALFRHSLFVGVEMRDVVEYQQGDFLIRQITGMAPDDGAIAVSAEVAPWQVLQFQLRDARTSAADLERRLAELGGATPVGGLMISCLGRGLHLYGRPDHDTDLVRAALGSIPLAGFFGNGEIGPVADQAYLHGYTTVLALLCPPA